MHVKQPQQLCRFQVYLAILQTKFMWIKKTKIVQGFFLAFGQVSQRHQSSERNTFGWTLHKGAFSYIKGR